MVTVSGPRLFIRLHDGYGVALVYGPEAEHATRACASDTRQYSRAGKGWLVPLDLVADLQAFAQFYHLLAVTYRTKREAS